MRVVLTAAAHERWWPRLERPGVEPLILGVDGGLVLASGAGVARDEADPEVAWGTSDLFDEGAPLRPFFGLLRRSSTLRWFQSPAAGYDGAVFGELARRGVRVSNAHVNGIPIAEYVLRAVLDHFQDAGRWRAGAEARGWRLHDFREVYGTTWLVVGLGSIGGAVATRARAFGARVIGCRRRPSADDPADETVTPERLLDVVGAADVVVLSAPSTAATVGLVDAAFLRAMKPGSLLVNV
ncbi:MAG TPA: NAD(P)-dependent oxidoreductase, partial [Acidimicrobiales bacterium]|nr:NAD(P)-dependent oxidoreductase [Acidimicrobiales bacterium]